MATLKKHGDHTVFEFIGYKKAYCSDGTILKNYGSGWKLYGKIKQGLTYKQACEIVQKNINESKVNRPFFQKYKKLMFQYSLAARVILETALKYLGDDIDGIWSEINDNPFTHKSLKSITFEEIQEIYNARQLALSEQKK
jgi:hypothetical protein